MKPDEQAEISEKVNDPHWRLNKLFTDVYFGDGAQNPSIVTRLATYEERQNGMEEKVNKIEAKIDKGFWLLLATLLSALGTLATLVLRH